MVTINRDRQFNREVTEYSVEKDLLGNSMNIDCDVNYKSSAACNDKGYLSAVSPLTPMVPASSSYLTGVNAASIKD